LIRLLLLGGVLRHIQYFYSLQQGSFCLSIHPFAPFPIVNPLAKTPKMMQK